MAQKHKDSATPAMHRAIEESRSLTNLKPCEACGNSNLTFDYEYRQTPYLFRCFAVCPKCGCEEEF